MSLQCGQGKYVDYVDLPKNRNYSRDRCTSSSQVDRAHCGVSLGPGPVLERIPCPSSGPGNHPLTFDRGVNVAELRKPPPLGVLRVLAFRLRNEGAEASCPERRIHSKTSPTLLIVSHS
eukprot:6239409-Amphidinium_carterae.1